MIVKGKTGFLFGQMAAGVTLEHLMAVRGWPGKEWTCHALRQLPGMKIEV